MPLLQQVFAYLVAYQCPLLVLDATDFGVLHELGVKTNSLDTDCRHQQEASQPLDPGDDVGYPAFQRRCQPPVFSVPIQKPRLAIARLALSP